MAAVYVGQISEEGGAIPASMLVWWKSKYKFPRIIHATTPANSEHQDYKSGKRFAPLTVARLKRQRTGDDGRLKENMWSPDRQDGLSCCEVVVLSRNPS